MCYFQVWQHPGKKDNKRRFIFIYYMFSKNQLGWGRSGLCIIILNFKHLCVARMFFERLACCPRIKSPWQSKNNVHTTGPHLDNQVEVFQVEVIPGILNSEVTLRLIHTYS